MQDNKPVTRLSGGGSLLGIVLLAVGVILLLDNLDVWDFDLGDIISRGWPLVLVFLGIKHLAQRRMVSGAVLLLLGVTFELIAWDLVTWRSMTRWWPVGLIVLGAWLLLGRGGGRQGRRRQGDGSGARDAADTFRVFQMWGGVRRVVTSRAFRGGEATAFMGGVEIDLRQAELAPEGARIDATALMGGVELHVPPGWQVTLTGDPFFGGIVDNRPPQAKGDDGATAPRLEIRATVLMGGLEID